MINGEWGCGMTICHWCSVFLRERRYRLFLGSFLLFCIGIGLFAASAQGASCDDVDFQRKLKDYAAVVKSFVDPNDVSAVLGVVSLYPEGDSPPVFTSDSRGRFQVQVPSKAAAFFLAGVDAMIQGNSLVAGWTFLEACWRNPTNAVFLNNAAFVFIQYRLFEEAIPILECTIKNNPTFSAANVNLGAASAYLGDHAKAANYYLRAVLVFPDNADYLFLSANDKNICGS
jgi:tetratricopeptide (TPR) repeat protein